MSIKPGPAYIQDLRLAHLDLLVPSPPDLLSELPLVFALWSILLSFIPRNTEAFSQFHFNDLRLEFRLYGDEKRAGLPGL